MIPDGWKQSALGEIVDTLMGFAFKSADFVEEGIPLVRMGNLYQNNFDLNRNGVSLPNDFATQYNKFLIRPGDLVMSLTGTLGKQDYGFTIEIPAYAPHCLLNQRVMKLIPKNGANKRYILYLLRSEIVLSKLYSYPGGTKQANLSAKQVVNVTVPIPTHKEQCAIATILTTWDRAIEKTEALIKAKERRKAGLMQRLLTGKVRFGEFGPVADDTPPTDWDTCRLEDICKRVTRKNPDGITHVLTASGEHGLVDQRDYFNRSVAGESLANYYLLKKGEFAYNRSSMKGYPYGAIKRLDRYEAGLLSTLYLCFRITSEKVDSDYLRHFFDSPILNKELRGIVQVGARAHGLLNVSTGDFMRLRVCIPSLKEQKRIAKCLDAATSEIEEHRNQLAALKEQKKGLMQQLLTGKVRVKAKE